MWESCRTSRLEKEVPWELLLPTAHVQTDHIKASVGDCLWTAALWAVASLSCTFFKAEERPGVIRALVALAQDQPWIPSTHGGSHELYSSSRDLLPSSGLHGYCTHMWYTCTPTGKTFTNFFCLGLVLFFVFSFSR